MSILKNTFLVNLESHLQEETKVTQGLCNMFFVMGANVFVGLIQELAIAQKDGNLELYDKIADEMVECAKDVKSYLGSLGVEINWVDMDTLTLAKFNSDIKH